MTADIKQDNNAATSKFQAAVISATDATAQAIAAATQAAHEAAAKQAAFATTAQHKLAGYHGSEYSGAGKSVLVLQSQLSRAVSRAAAPLQRR